VRFSIICLTLLLLTDQILAETSLIGVKPTEKEEVVQQQILDAGTLKLTSGQPAVAITDYFDKVISFYESKISGATTKYYAARSQAETLFYLLDAAAKSKKNAIVLKSTYGDAYFLRGYSLAALNRDVEAKASIETAIAISPQNAQFLAELGNHFARLKNWDSSLKTYRSAESAAREFSPDEFRKTELGRALRGQGYALVELNRLSEAEQAYQKCIDLDSNDRKAIAELRYVQSLKAK
jgi:tetratricopeptide (TPR) repeat protein